MNRQLFPAQPSSKDWILQLPLLAENNGCLERLKLSQITLKYPSFGRVLSPLYRLNFCANKIYHLNRGVKIIKKKSEDIVALFYREVLALLSNEEQAKLFSSGNFDLLDSRRNPSRKPITSEYPLLLSVMRPPAWDIRHRHKSRLLLDPDHNA